MSTTDWSGNVYLDLDVILAELKEDDWLASEVELEAVESPKTSVATGIELQYVMEDDWPRDRVVCAHREITESGIEMVPLEGDALDAAADLRSRYDSLNVFDGIHLGTAHVLGETIVSTDTLYPAISDVEHADPRDLG